MSGPKNPANAALCADRRKDATLQAHDEARKVVKDLLDRRGNGEPPAQLRKRKGVYGSDIMRQGHLERVTNALVSMVFI